MLLLFFCFAYACWESSSTLRTGSSCFKPKLPLGWALLSHGQKTKQHLGMHLSSILAIFAQRDWRDYCELVAFLATTHNLVLYFVWPKHDVIRICCNTTTHSTKCSGNFQMYISVVTCPVDLQGSTWKLLLNKLHNRHSAAGGYPLEFARR